VAGLENQPVPAEPRFDVDELVATNGTPPPALPAAPRLNLRPCPDCGELASLHAIRCPHCGCPIKPLPIAPNNGATVTQAGLIVAMLALLLTVNLLSFVVPRLPAHEKPALTPKGIARVSQRLRRTSGGKSPEGRFSDGVLRQLVPELPISMSIGRNLNSDPRQRESKTDADHLNARDFGTSFSATTRSLGQSNFCAGDF
jgi:hypothetical protein